MRENRFDKKYLEYSENIYKKIILLSKESKAFKKDFENMFSVQQMNGDLTKILNLSKTKKNKKKKKIKDYYIQLNKYS